MAAGASRILIQGEAGNIEIVSQAPPHPRGVAVVAHPHPLFGGTMDNKVVTTLARAFFEAGLATFRFNFRGVGGTQGNHDEGRGESDDMRLVAEHAHGTLPQAPLYLAGFSFGGAVATRVSGAVEFRQLVLVAPGFRRIHAHGMGAAPDPNDRALGEPGRHNHTNTLVIHGDLDETVPLSDSIAWATPREVPVVVVPGAEHFFHRKLHLLRDIATRWVK